jgi:hypothetical protein
MFQPTNGLLMSEFQGRTPGSTINCRFTQFSVPAQAAPHFNAPTNAGPLNFQDCEFHGGKLLSAGPTLNFTNCLLERVYTDIQPKDGCWSYLRNCLIYYGTFGFGPTNSIIADNLFQAPTTQDWIGGRGNTYSGYNAYYPYFNYSRLRPTNINDKLYALYVSWEPGPLGNFYHATTALMNSGNNNADQVSLYHYTTATNLSGGCQIRETNSVVDFGYHYVAVDSSGLPISTSGDTIGDYLKDSNGSGTYDDGDIGNFTTNDTCGDGISDFVKFIQGRNLNVRGVNDTNGLTNLKVYTPLN